MVRLEQVESNLRIDYWRDADDLKFEKAKVSQPTYYILILRDNRQQMSNTDHGAFPLTRHANKWNQSEDRLLA